MTSKQQLRYHSNCSRDRKVPILLVWSIGYYCLLLALPINGFTQQHIYTQHDILLHSSAHETNHKKNHRNLQLSTQPHENDAFWKRFCSFSVKTMASLGLAFSLLAPTPTFASDSSSLMVGQKYWTIMNEGEPEERVIANVALMDYAVGTINTMYYDHTGGATFQPGDFFKVWRQWLESSKETLDSRDGLETGLRFLTQQLQDPYSRYLSRDELEQERKGMAEGSAGFLRLGVMVEAPTDKTFFRSSLGAPVLAEIPPSLPRSTSLLPASKVQGLPVATAVSPNSQAERMGLTVGDRVVAIQQESFIGKDASKVLERYKHVGQDEATEMTIAKPLYAATSRDDRDVIIAYRSQRLRLPSGDIENGIEKRDTPALVRSELLEGRQSSLFETDQVTSGKVGYVRLTGFSKATTTAFVEAVEQLEAQGAEDYIIDLRNNYGGVIQEAMLTASSLLRDPHAVLCFTLNAGGGFSPHDVTEYVMHPRYPGYIMSNEPRTVTVEQVQKESPEFFNAEGEWSPPSAYASLHEQSVKRGIRRASTVAASAKQQQELLSEIPKQKNIAILVNEGTASSAEVFASALRDNGRTVALIGTKTFGKGLIQHTFPLPDGGALCLTIAEYLTPSLRHVTQVGAAQFDQYSGRWVGGGIKPDILCESRGIPSNIGGDYCVGVALDTLTSAKSRSSMLTRSDGFAGSNPSMVQNVSEKNKKNDF